MRGFGIIASTLACLAVAALLASRAGPVLAVEERYQPGEFQAARDSITYSLFGQLRMSLGDLMWLKTLEYLHNGIIYRMPSDHERARGIEAREFTGMGAGVAHMDGPSLVPGPERDWRGVLGALNRHIEPWRPGHARHSDPQELIPWYQLLVRFNPHYTQAYVNGAFFLSDNAQAPERARAFLRAGAEKNPWSFEIHAALGKLHFDHFRDYDAASTVLEQAATLAAEETAYLEVRDGELDAVQKQLLGECYLYLARSYEAVAAYDKALDATGRGLAEAPDYTLLRVERRILERKRAAAGDGPQDAPTVFRTAPEDES